jgi:hypothetical protein
VNGVPSQPCDASVGSETVHLPTSLGMRVLRVVAIVVIVLGSLSVAFGLLAIAGSENAREYAYCAAFVGAGVVVVVLGSLLRRLCKRTSSEPKTIGLKDATGYAAAAPSAFPGGSTGERKCPACGSLAQESWSWCIRCGTALSVDPATKTEQVSDEQGPASTGDVLIDAAADAVVGLAVGVVLDKVIDGVLDNL